MKNLKLILSFLVVIFTLYGCQTNEINEEQDLVEESIEDIIDEEIENSFDENKIYELEGDSWITVSVSKAPARAEVILEVYFEDGTIEKSESDPNRYLSKSIRIDKNAVKAKLRVIDRDNLSGIEFSVFCKLSNLDRDYYYFQILEEDVRGFSETILFKKE